MGGSEREIKGEFDSNGVKNTLSHTRGAISMARSQRKDSASSQFFIAVSYTHLDHQARSFTKEYGLTEQVDLLSGNSTQVFNRLTRRVQQVIREELDKKPELYEDTGHLDEVNAELQKHYAYLVVRKGTDIIYFGDTDEADVYKRQPWGYVHFLFRKMSAQ